MMTREEVMEAANADPHGFGFRLASKQLLNIGDLTDEIREVLSPSWAPLAEAFTETDFYSALIELWHQGCGENAFAPKFLEKQLKYAGFTSLLNGGFGIQYITSVPDKDATLSHFYGLPPVEKRLLDGSPDYGPLTFFCERVHGSISTRSASFLRHPAWVSVNPTLGTATTGMSWSKFYEETMDDMGEPMTFSEGSEDKTEDETFRPDIETTVQFSNSNTYHFVEPGNPTKFWRFWSSRGDMELQDGSFPTNTLNPVDECLSYILGADLN